ncbi:odorant receptor Or2-like isoform X2 [Polyergus mexicanus]|uniref:odorant receptor Or2-like isoform X2 n=1 Tax=Polyergus mexicanus TaxID=615972 RepID=UPI0038B52CEA
MDFFDNEYYGLTRNLMATIGLWPYQKPEHRIVRALCVSFILVLAILLQIKKLFDQIQRDWNLIKDMNELKILQKYAYKAKFYTVFSGLIVYPGTFAFLLIIFIPDILDKIMPLDEPRSRQFPIHIEIFFDKERYFYYISILFIIAAFLGMTVLMATEIMYMTFLQHACCLFELISHRLTYAFNTYLSRTTPLKTECKFCTKLFNAFITHQHCLEFIEDLQRGFSSSYFVLCVFGVASLSINMFRLLNAITIYNIIEAILIGLFVYAHFCYIFWMNYFGQDIIDHSECFFQQIYNIRWYRVPLYAQKLLLIALQRSAKSSRIIIGSLFVASLEGFATLIKMSTSYCMVMYSVRT